MVAVPSTMLPLGTPAPEFRLPDTDDRSVALDQFRGQPLLVAFLCNHCPFVKHIADEFGRVAREAQAQGTAVVAINSNDTEKHPDDAPPRMRDERQARGWTFAYLFDESQEVAKAYRAACTPDLYLFDREHRLFYRGRFDETRPQQTPPQLPHGADLRGALAALHAGQPAPAVQHASIGCNIKWKPGRAPDYFPG